MSDDTQPSTGPASPSAEEETAVDPTRRRFVTRVTVGAGALVTGAVAAPSVGMLLSPLLTSDEGEGAAGWRTVAPVARFAVAGKPVRVQVKEDRQDKWLRRYDVPVGSVLVRRTAEAEFQVLSAKCPHLGCSVKPVPDADEFLCPCHRSHFAGDGSLLPHADGQPNPAPRALDRLQWRIAGGALQVKWVEYRTGTAEQVPIG